MTKKSGSSRKRRSEMKHGPSQETQEARGLAEYAEKANANANMLMHVVSYMAHHTTDLSDEISQNRTFGIPLADLSAGDRVTFSVVDGILIISAPLPEVAPSVPETVVEVPVVPEVPMQDAVQ